MKHDDNCCHSGGIMPCICALPATATPGTLEDDRRRIAGSLRRDRWLTKGEAEQIERAADEIASLRARVEVMREALVDLMSWFPEKPSDPEWRIKGGKFGADDAVEHARSLVEKEPAT